MLTRLYLDNFRCFVNFEYRPARRQLILGANGSGKSTMLSALLALRHFVTSGEAAEKFFVAANRTRWLNQPDQKWEIEAALDGRTVVYRLVVEYLGDPPRPRVKSEVVHSDGKPLFEFIEGEVRLFNDRFEHTVTFPFDTLRSGLATVPPRRDNAILTHFKEWLARVYCFRLNPFRMDFKAEREDLAPTLDLHNFAAWYRHIVQALPKENAKFLAGLTDVVDEISYLRLEPVGETTRVLRAELRGRSDLVFVSELSDGQRCLICLYAILHFVVARGRTVIMDEPDNFVALREIQPWLMALEDAVEEGKGQVLLISHHPELINQWAGDCGVRFFRDASGPVRIEEFRGDASNVLAPAEIIARGWERE